MKIHSQTYRIFSALTLILFLSSIVLPSGISAASLFCDMEMDMNMAAMQADTHTCCDVHDIEKANHHRAETTNEHCNGEQICLHTLSPAQADVQAVVTVNQGKDFAALAVLTSEFPDRTDKKDKTRVSEPALTIPNYSPPLFLLNSSFLN
jgi:hypothetical protein